MPEPISYTIDEALVFEEAGEAQSLLAPVYAWFSEGLDTPLLQNAKALLDQLG